MITLFKMYGLAIVMIALTILVIGFGVPDLISAKSDFSVLRGVLAIVFYVPIMVYFGYLIYKETQK